MGHALTPLISNQKAKSAAKRALTKVTIAAESAEPRSAWQCRATVASLVFPKSAQSKHAEHCRPIAVLLEEHALTPLISNQKAKSAAKRALTKVTIAAESAEP